MTVANVTGMYDYLLIPDVTCGNRNPYVSGQITVFYSEATVPLVRTKHEISEFFSDFELIKPGTVYLAQWRRVTKYYAGGGTRWGQASVGGKTGLSANAPATNDAAFPGPGATRRSP
jgi:S-adenosyl methyltransferase